MCDMFSIFSSIFSGPGMDPVCKFSYVEELPLTAEHKT